MVRLTVTARPTSEKEVTQPLQHPSDPTMTGAQNQAQDMHDGITNVLHLSRKFSAGVFRYRIIISSTK